MEGAELALKLARQGGFKELEPVALGLLGDAFGMRGMPGDLARAIDLVEEAMKTWVRGTRQADLAECYHLATDHYNWAGDYDRALEAAQLAATTAGVAPHSREMRLRGAGTQALILAGTGQYEEAIAASDDAIELAAAMGRPTSVVMNYSTLALREIFAVDEALRRSEEVAERLGPSDFNMPWMNARADVFAAHVIQGDLTRALSEWESLWEDAITSKAWEQWLVSGRIAAARADLELLAGNVDDAITWAGRALDMAQASSRKKYEAIASTTLGRALLAGGLPREALSHLRRAVALGDNLRSPLLRWRARAALADALYGAGRDPEAPRQEAATIIREVVAGLRPERAATYLGAPEVVEVLESAGGERKWSAHPRS